MTVDRWRAVWAGFGSAFGIFQRMPESRRARRVLTSADAARTDAEALAGDWQRIGDDMRRAMVAADRDKDGG